MDDAWPASRRYLIWSSANWAAFIAAVAFLAWDWGAFGTVTPLIRSSHA